MKRKHAVSRILTNSPESIPGEFYSGKWISLTVYVFITRNLPGMRMVL